MKETKVIQELVSPEVFKLNHAVMNKAQMQFSPEKRLEKRKWINHSCQLIISVHRLCYKMG